MEEEEARATIERMFAVPRETMERLDHFADLLRRENKRQNLVSTATLDRIWLRHFLDSAQLLRFVSNAQSSWVDLGSGAGLPGIVIALLHPGPVTLVEERRLRVEFLHQAAAALDLDVEIIRSRVERLDPRPFDVISARAFAPLPKLLDLSARLSTIDSLWLLPKGRNAKSELEALPTSWQGDFALEPSLTDEEAKIIVAHRVRRGGKGRDG